MKNKWTKNLVLKLLSVAVAFVIWLVIINITDPTVSKRFTDIPVEILNENVITTMNQVYEVESGKKVDVTVKAKRSFVEELTEADFQATADLSKLSTVNTAGIDVKLVRTTKENVELDWNNEVLRIKLEEKDTQQFKVQIATEGDLAESYVLGEVITQPNMIEVSGGVSKIKRIASIGAMIQLNGQDRDFEAEITPILYDSDRDVIDGSNVSFSTDKIVVKVQVLPTKSIPVYVEVSGEPAEGYRHIQTDHKPESILVSGTKAELEKMKSITIPVSIDGAKEDVEQEIDLTQYVGDCEVVDEFSAVSVRCVIEKNGKRTFSFVNSDVNIKNLPENMNCSYIDENKRQTITILGGEEYLQSVTLSSLGASIDVSGLGAGRHNVEVQFDLPENLKLKSKVRVEVLLTQSGEGQINAPVTQNPTVTPAATAD
nr:hypothetical protein [Eubacterium sp.]